MIISTAMSRPWSMAMSSGQPHASSRRFGVLVDFRVARLAGEVMHAGTRGFVAPEVGAGGAISPAADVYSLAATTVALITGRAPDPGRPLFEGVDPGEVGPLTRALRRALSSDPANRQGLRGNSHMNSNPAAEHRGRAFSASWSR